MPLSAGRPGSFRRPGALERSWSEEEPSLTVGLPVDREPSLTVGLPVDQSRHSTAWTAPEPAVTEATGRRYALRPRATLPGVVLPPSSSDSLTKRLSVAVLGVPLVRV